MLVYWAQRELEAVKERAAAAAAAERLACAEQASEERGEWVVVGGELEKCSERVRVLWQTGTEGCRSLVGTS